MFRIFATQKAYCCAKSALCAEIIGQVAELVDAI